jgi:hypothetical protein
MVRLAADLLRSGRRATSCPASLNDRFFSLLVFLHIGIPLLLLLALWVHIQRVSQSDVFPSRALGFGTLAMLLALALVKPTVSHGKADLTHLPTCCTSTGTTCSSIR